MVNKEDFPIKNLDERLPDLSGYDVKVDKDGFTHLLWKSRPTVSDEDLERLDKKLGMREADLVGKSKEQLVQMVLEWGMEIERFKKEFASSSVEGVPESPFGSVLAALRVKVGEILRAYPIKYVEEKRGASTKREPVAWQLLMNLAVGNTLKSSAALAGMHINTFDDWRKTDPEGMGMAVEAARALFFEVGKYGMMKLAVGGEIIQIEESDGPKGHTRRIRRSIPEPRVVLRMATAEESGSFMDKKKVDVDVNFNIPMTKEDEERFQNMGRELAMKKAEDVYVVDDDNE